MAGNQFKTDELGGLTFSATYTTEQYPLGTVAYQHPDDLPAVTINGTVVGNSGVSSTTNFASLSGTRRWIFVRAAEAVAAGALCEWDSNTYTTPFSVEPCDEDAKDRYLLAGVADNAIAEASYGWILQQGTCVILASAGLAIGEAIDSDGSSGTEGSVDTTAGVAGSIGHALEAVSGTLTNYAQCYIDLA